MYSRFAECRDTLLDSRIIVPIKTSFCHKSFYGEYARKDSEEEIEDGPPSDPEMIETTNSTPGENQSLSKQDFQDITNKVKIGCSNGC